MLEGLHLHLKNKSNFKRLNHEINDNSYIPVCSITNDTFEFSVFKILYEVCINRFGTDQYFSSGLCGGHCMN